jgi:DNA-binding FadR family transcriptional regulator
MTKTQDVNDVVDAISEPPRATRATGRRLHGAVAHKLGTAILSGKYAPGDTLSGEVEFSAMLDVSRTAYREAIQVLTAKGLVESRPKIGTRILPRSRWNLLDPDVLAWSLSLPRRRWPPTDASAATSRS